MSKNSDVIVIGGGINGVSTAFQLARQGAKVTLLEKSFIAGGPTGSSSAIIRQHYSNEITARMVLNSLRVWQNFEDVVGAECDFTQTGFLMAVLPEDVDSLKENISLQQSVGIDTKFVNPEEMQEIEPHMNPAGLGGAAYEPEAGFCDPNLSANSYAKAAKRHGASIRTGVTVTEIKQEKGRIVGVETNEGFVSAGAVIIVAGPWSTSMLSQLGVALPMVAARASIVFLRRPEGFDRHLIWADFITQNYMRPETGGLMLVGSISPKEAEDTVENPDNFNDRVDMQTLAEFAESAALRYPAMEESHLTSSYTALYSITPDWHPVMDAVPDHDGLYVCTGGSGHCFKLAPAIGEMMAQLVLKGKHPNDDINLFSFDRFTKKGDVDSQYDYKIIA
ncbi:MAG: FAD-binding oxidoreductase [Chloroflexi bacterium]|nr:FAD-binding oxidoreductase [Chloroflexota bacterium]